jgi:hypothetical protein
MKRPVRRPKTRTRTRSRDGARQSVVVIAIGAVIAAGLFATGKYVAARQQTPPLIMTMAAAKAKTAARDGTSVATTASSDDEIYTGSILYMPDEGQICHQLFFDNLTGRLSDNGYVDCQRAIYGNLSGTPMQMSAARVRVISTGFRDH